MEPSYWLIYGQDFTVLTITMETVRFHIFSLSQEIQVERNTKKIFKKWNLIFSSQT